LIYQALYPVNLGKDISLLIGLLRMNLGARLIIDNDNHSERGRKSEVYLALPPYFFSLIS
jgi:hypothetical protein